MAMKPKPPMNVEDWRDQEPERIEERNDGRDVRISKHTRMRLRFSEMLRDEAYRQSREQATRVSEADLLDQALSEWAERHQIPTD